MNVVLDASAILAFLQDETGADQVEQSLLTGACCSAINLSEVAQKVRAAGRDWSSARALLASYEFHVETASEVDAEWAANRWKRREGLSLADRFCLALGARLDQTVLTTDSAWGSSDNIRQLR